ncbi:MAG TPA: multidrug effflux MFS transporter [Cellulomonas sp.]
MPTPAPAAIGPDLQEQQPHVRIGPALLVVLALLAGIAPFATDMYLPAFPEMVSDLATTPSGVQLSLTTFLVGAGIGQLVFGPLSDRIGRRRPLVVGMVLYVVASAIAALAPTIGVLIGARLVQGMAGAAGMVISRAIITDLTRGAAAARAMSVVMLISGVAPVLAPVAGSVLADPIGWRGLLWVVTALVAVGLVATLAVVRETRPPAVQSPEHQPSSASKAAELTSRAYLGNMLSYVLAFTSMMAYISASPFLYQTMVGLSEVQYGLVFGLNALALMIVGGLSARLTRRFRVESLARTGLLINVAAVAAFGVLVLTTEPSLWLAVPILVSVGSLGLVFGNTTARALASVPTATGLGSAILGMLQHVLAGAVAPIVSIGGGTTAVPLAITMLVASIAANIALAFSRGADRSTV